MFTGLKGSQSEAYCSCIKFHIRVYFVCRKRKTGYRCNCKVTKVNINQIQESNLNFLGGHATLTDRSFKSNPLVLPARAPLPFAHTLLFSFASHPTCPPCPRHLFSLGAGYTYIPSPTSLAASSPPKIPRPAPTGAGLMCEMATYSASSSSP